MRHLEPYEYFTYPDLIEYEALTVAIDGITYFAFPCKRVFNCTVCTVDDWTAKFFVHFE